VAISATAREEKATSVVTVGSVIRVQLDAGV